METKVYLSSKRSWIPREPRQAHVALQNTDKRVSWGAESRDTPSMESVTSHGPLFANRIHGGPETQRRRGDSEQREGSQVGRVPSPSPLHPVTPFDLFSILDFSSGYHLGNGSCCQMFENHCPRGTCDLSVPFQSARSLHSFSLLGMAVTKRRHFFATTMRSENGQPRSQREARAPGLQQT